MPDAMAQVLAEQERVLGAADVGPVREQLATTMGPSTPFLASWLEHPRFVRVAQQILGEDVLGFSAYAMRYVGDTGWHTDDRSAEVPGLKMVVPCSRTRADSGALRVVPGSHRIPLDDRVRDAYARDIAAVPSHVCETDPGDMVVFDNRIWHASCGGSNDRRACYLYFLRNPRTEAELTAARTFTPILELARQRYGPSSSLPSAWFEQLERAPLRQRWIERMREIGWLDAAGLRR